MTGAGWDAVFLDRDGTLTVAPPPGDYVLSADALKLLPRAGEAVGRLCALGVPVFVVTNQRAIHLGLLSPQTMAELNGRLEDLLRPFGGRLEAILVCPHGVGSCDCRKPRDGLLRQVFASRPALRAPRCAIVGDTANDVRAGDTLGLVRVLLGTMSAAAPDLAVDFVAGDLAAAVDWLVQPGRHRRR